VYILGLPVWIDIPESQEKSTNEKVTFHCLANYATEHKWFVNGVPVDDSMYQCLYNG